MIQVLDKNEVKVYYFPRNLVGYYDQVTLNVWNHTYKTTFEIETTYSDYEPINYYKFEVDFSEIPDGEYTYQLEGDDGTILSYGLLQIGIDFKKHTIKEYKG